jgi:excisionase family DNA binding protein
MHVATKPQATQSVNGLLTRREAAEFLRISERTLFTLTASGTIPKVKLGSRVLYSMKSLQAFIDKAEQAAVGQ